MVLPATVSYLSTDSRVAIISNTSTNICKSDYPLLSQLACSFHLIVKILYVCNTQFISCVLDIYYKNRADISLIDFRRVHDFIISRHLKDSLSCEKTGCSTLVKMLKCDQTNFSVISRKVSQVSQMRTRVHLTSWFREILYFRTKHAYFLTQTRQVLPYPHPTLYKKPKSKPWATAAHDAYITKKACFHNNFSS